MNQTDYTTQNVRHGSELSTSFKKVYTDYNKPTSSSSPKGWLYPPQQVTPQQLPSQQMSSQQFLPQQQNNYEETCLETLEKESQLVEKKLKLIKMKEELAKKVEKQEKEKESGLNSVINVLDKSINKTPQNSSPPVSI